MDEIVVGLHEIGPADLPTVGGKAAGLGALTRIGGVTVPPGLCVTTAAFRQVVAEAVHGLLDRLAAVGPDDPAAVREVGAELRATVEGLRLPEHVAAAIVDHLDQHEGDPAWAVRSSATAEDLPTASFAGQHDSHLDVRGGDAVLRAVRSCWASLFTDRAISYRTRAGIDHRDVRMAVVLQRMVPARAAGVLFTADPLTGDRRVTTIEAVEGLGDALVAGEATPDVVRVRDGRVVERSVAGREPVLTDAHVRALVGIGARIAAGLGAPQDVEWCLAADGVHVVQARPITTLYPVPEVDDDRTHVYLSVGHQQMMTDAMRPLGISLWQHTSPAPMVQAGSRLFVDVTDHLASPTRRAALLENARRSDPLVADALHTVVERDLVPRSPDEPPGAPAPASAADPVDVDPAIVPELIARTDASIAQLERTIRGRTGADLLDLILADLQELRRVLFDPQSHRVVMGGIEAVWWLNDHVEAWLGERNAADPLTQAVPHNVTSAMGLALLDVADVIRPHPQVVAVLEQATAEDDGFLDALDDLPGGPAARAAIEGYLARYGMRCVGEIDVTRPRWRERPGALVPLILANVANFAPGERQRRLEQGRREARQAAEALLARLRALPDGEAKAAEAERMIERIRALIGYREFPKYGMVRRYGIYREALLEEAERLVGDGVLGAPDDPFFLTLPELVDVVRTRRVDARRIRQRRQAFLEHQSLTAPRVLTSDGEMLGGRYRRKDLPEGALVGLAVSAGVAEGRARVVPDLAEADLQPGDILVTAATDPSWTPAFVAIGGLVTEVGGLMTHGAVIAREYGLPAVVGVQRATALIADGQRIRVHGSAGHVELLS